MAKTRVPAVWIANGTLPGTCARHDAPATRQSQRTFYTRTPAWLVLLVLVSLLIAVIIMLVTRGTLEGRIPACERCVADRRKFVAIAWASWAVATGLLVAGISTGSGALAGISALLIVVALVFSFCGDQFRVSGALSKDRTWVDLKGTSESFSAQIQQAVGQVPAGAQGAVQP